MRLDNRHLPVLEELTQYILWMGRYPVPKRAEAFAYSSGSNLRHKALWQAYHDLFVVLQRRVWKHTGDWLRVNFKQIFPEDHEEE